MILHTRTCALFTALLMMTVAGPPSAMRVDGLSDEEARSRFWGVGKDGLLHAGRMDLTPEQRVYAQTWDRGAAWPRTLTAQIGGS